MPNDHAEQIEALKGLLDVVAKARSQTITTVIVRLSLAEGRQLEALLSAKLALLTQEESR